MVVVMEEVEKTSAIVSWAEAMEVVDQAERVELMEKIVEVW